MSALCPFTAQSPELLTQAPPTRACSRGIDLAPPWPQRHAASVEGESERAAPFGPAGAVRDNVPKRARTTKIHAQAVKPRPPVFQRMR